MDGVAMVKIKGFKVGARGKRGLVITLPTVWAGDVGVEPGSELAVYRDTLDRLVIVKEESK